VRVVVLGGSVAGITVGLLAAQAGHDVTVLERSSAAMPSGPEEAWPMWPWLRQPHAFLPGLRALLLARLPEVYRAFMAAGAVELPAPGGGIAMAARRTTFELALRRCARDAGLRVRYATTVTGLDVSPDGVGVHARAGGECVRAGAAVVIDATGRRSGLRRWLPGAVGEDAAAGGMEVRTRFYRAARPIRLAGGVSESTMGPGWCWYAFKADGGYCSLSLARPARPGIVRPADFEAAARDVPFARAVLRAAVPAGPVHAIRVPAAVIRHATAPGVLPVGDALLTTSPVYGLGVLLAVDQAAALAGLLAAPGSPRQLSSRWAELCGHRYRPTWQWAAAADAHLMNCWQAGRIPSPVGAPPLEVAA
jgi:2-polyprenyl-6-methoxyphenol hydroxylase-like FAD-dependent oxidoreductase